MKQKIEAFTKKHLQKGKRPIPARLQSALALLERVRDLPTLELMAHLAGKGSSGLESHETFGNRAHERLKLELLNKNHGRRSSNLQDWGQDLLDILRDEGFQNASSKTREQLIDSIQKHFASILRGIIEQDPLEVHVRGRSAEAIIQDVLEQAEEKGKSGDVAQYLVGAKLMLRFKRDIPVHPANKGDRKSRVDSGARAGDFEIENAVIEVAIGLPDDAHTSKVAESLENSECEVWILTRADRVDIWKRELKDLLELNARRVVVTSVAAFVGQNITELGEFSSKGKAAQMGALFEIYNTHWIDKVGTPGIRIVIK